MRGFHKTAAIILAAAAVSASGCKSGGSRRMASTEPGLSIVPGTTVASTTPPATASAAPAWVDRHPLFSKPRDYYEKSTSNNKFMKGATATIVGVPVGLFGEIKQIVVGKPSQAVPIEMK